MSSFLPLCSQRLPAPFPVQKRRELVILAKKNSTSVCTWNLREKGVIQTFSLFTLCFRASLVSSSTLLPRIQSGTGLAGGGRVFVRDRQRTPGCANRDYPPALLFPGIPRKPGLLGMYVSDCSLPTRSSEGHSRLPFWQGGCTTLRCRGLTCPCCF